MILLLQGLAQHAKVCPRKVLSCCLLECHDLLSEASVILKSSLLHY